MIEKTLESPLDCKEIKHFNPKGNQPWIFIERADAEALILWPPDAKSWLIGKDPDAGEDWRQKEKGVTEDEMVRWHHWLNGREFEQALSDGGGQRRLVSCSPRGCKELGHVFATEQQQLREDLTGVDTFFFYIGKSLRMHSGAALIQDAPGWVFEVLSQGCQALCSDHWLWVWGLVF